MKFKNLGTTDIKVSLICLGTMTYGEQNTQEEGFEQMDYALEKGVNFLTQLNYMQYLQKKKLTEKLKKLLEIGLKLKKIEIKSY